MEILKKGDDGRQKNRQSKDFKEIWSTQSNMEVDDFKWDKMFHNWDSPKDCKQNRHYKTCSICDMIKKGKSVTHLRPTEK